MSAAKHTPGLVVHDARGYPHADVRSTSGRKIATTWGSGNPTSAEAYQHRTDEDRANARRIVACWNACDGVPTEVLEAQQSGGLPWNVGERIDEKVKTDRRIKALVDALGEINSCIFAKGAPLGSDDYFFIRQKCVDMIKANGGTA